MNEKRKKVSLNRCEKSEAGIEFGKRLEKILKERAGGSACETSDPAVMNLIHEFEACQVELELQNQELRRMQIEFENQRKRYDDLFDSAPVGFVALTPKGLVARANRAAEEMLAGSGEVLTGKGFSRWIHAKDHSLYFSCLRKALDSGDRHACEVCLSGKCESLLRARIEARAHFDKAGNITEWRLTISDIPERKMAEQAMRRSEQHLRDVLNNMVAIIGVMTPQGALIETNRIALEAANLKSEDVLGKPLEECYWWSWSPEVQKRLCEAIELAAAGQGSRYHEMIRIGDGQFRTIDFMLAPIFGPDGCVSYLVASATDITELKRSEEELRKTREELAQGIRERTAELEKQKELLGKLSSELTLSEQREQRRLAGILHDHLQQFLVAAKMNCETFFASIGREHERDAENILSLITQSLQASRSLTVELSPPVLQQGGLSAALEWLVRWMQENHGLKIELQTEPGMDPEREDITVLLFQSVRELLFNVVKHAKVKSARLKISGEEENRLRVAVIDQGAGFDPDTIWEKAQAATGFGLFSIRERLRLMGGRFEVDSSPGSGAAFSLIVPLEMIKKNDGKGG